MNILACARWARLLPAILALAIGTISIRAADNAIALKAKRIFDGKSKSLVPNGVVIVQGDRIVDVGSNLAVPGDAQVIDLNVSEQAIIATVHARATVEAGFTTVRDLGSRFIASHEFVDVALRNAINKGVIVGPRMLVATKGIGATGGHFDPTSGFRDFLFGREPDYTDGIANGPDEIRKAVRFEVKNGADVIKAAVSGGVFSLADEVDTPQFTPAEMAALVDESHRLRKKVAVHCHGDQAAREAIEAGVDSIEHGSFLKPETLTLMKNKGTFLTPTLMASEYIMSKIDSYPPAVQAKGRAAAAARSEMFRNAVKIGIKISFGTDAGVFPHGQNAKEFKLMVDLGMAPIDALISATSADAELLGVSQRVGTL